MIHRRSLLLSAALGLSAAVIIAPGHSQARAVTVNVATLLPQMGDMTWLARRPAPAFTMAQASSYDRNSKQTPEGIGGDAFANGDAGQYLRTETGPEGRKEFVMADLTGPGAVVRVWSANPAGTIHYYFDGEATPRFSAPMADLLTGKVKPFAPPFAYEASRGTNLYFPFPYAKSLKITASENKPNELRGLYYHVGYRTYAKDTTVETFTPGVLNAPEMAGMLARTAQALNPTPKNDADRGVKRTSVSGVPSSQKALTLTLDAPQGGGAVQQLLITMRSLTDDEKLPWTDPRRRHNVLRSLIVAITFDGQETVHVPLSDFFGTPVGMAQMKTLPLKTTQSGTGGRDSAFLCRFVMPFGKRAQIRLEKVNGSPTPQTTLTADVAPFRFDSDTYLFHAGWSGETSRTRPYRDMTIMNATGEGNFVGAAMAISNPTPAWWGEGDEKVYVDGEKFPSTFGTGTEDYFGYAWCSPELFTQPYHAQPRCDGPGNFGHTAVSRFHIFDPIPFTKSLKFDIELWHWQDVTVTVARTAYWYARPGSSLPGKVNVAALTVPEMKPPAPVAGAIEGETLELVSKTGGNLTVQEGFWETSGNKQRWWTSPEPGQKLTLRFPVKTAGTYRVVGHFCQAPDYGIHRLTLNGQAVAEPMDFYSPQLGWKKRTLGTFTLPAGNATLEVECVGANPASRPGNMFGLDYLLLERVP
jgi:hypothetical protein